MKHKTGLFVSDDSLSQFVFEKMGSRRQVFPFSFTPVSFTESNIMAPGNMEKLLYCLKQNHIAEIAFIGRIPASSAFRADMHHSGKALMHSVHSWRGEDLLSALVSALEQHGIKVLKLTDIMADAMAEKRGYTDASPGKQEIQDISTGIELLKTLMQYRAGQATAVLRGMIIAIEGIEGTDAMIKRAGNHCRGFTLVKIAGKNKDERFDLPVIGPGTVQQMASAGGSVIAAEAGRTVIFDEKKTVKLCNENNIALLGIET